MPPDPSDPFTRVDLARLARHEQFLAIWRELPLDELIADLGVLTQFVGFRARTWTTEDLVLDEARRQQAEGATHDCTEWCQLCGKRAR
jgi:hypothetical protein